MEWSDTIASGHLCAIGRFVICQLVLVAKCLPHSPITLCSLHVHIKHRRYHATKREMLRRLLHEAFGAAVDLVWAKAAGADTMARLVSEEMNLGLGGDSRGDAFLPEGDTWESMLRDAFKAGVACG